jgi:hypothetical protein
MKVKLSRCITLGMLLCLLLAESQAAAKENGHTTANDSMSVSPRSALLRSLVIPGWGQLHNGHPWKAALFAGSASGFLASALLEVRSLDDAAPAQEREARSNRRNTRFVYFGLTVTLAAIDAFVDAHLTGFDHVGVSASADAAYMRLDKRW